ncbi:MAG: hypothetical protein ACYDIA_07660 [Candidatus Humimicrobiaceae bacterium]
MVTKLCFDNLLKNIQKKELSMVEDYYNRTKSYFDNIEKEADECAKSFYNNYPATEHTDPSEIADEAIDLGSEFYNTLSIMKSNHLLLTISMLYHIWEQQLIKFTLESLEYDNFTIPKNSLTYAQVQKIFEAHNIFIINTRSWLEKIRELKSLTNTIKHAGGDSAEKLRKIRPDFFKSKLFEGADTLEFHKSILLSPYAIQVNENDFYDYVKATKEFWDEMPKEAYSDIDKINNKLSELNIPT